MAAASTRPSATIRIETASISKAFSNRVGGSYGYRVRGCFALMCSGWSAVAVVVVNREPTAPLTLSGPSIGPDGNYTSKYSDYYVSRRYKNEWGDAINFDGQDSDEVRAFFAQALPPDIRRKCELGQRISKPEMLRWVRILHEQGWATPSWARTST